MSEEQGQLNVINSIEFFDFMRAFFTDRKKYACLTDKAKSAHIFMWSRMMSIMYPVAMHACSKVHSTRVMDILHSKMCTNDPKKYPSWLFTKSSKNQSSEDEKAITEMFSAELINAYKQINHLEHKSFIMIISMDRAGVIDDLKELKDTIENDKIKPKKFNQKTKTK
jgi:hypothetical protein